MTRREIRLPAGSGHVQGTLDVPEGTPAVVVFAHGSGSSRHSPRNRAVAEVLGGAGLATLLIDLLTEDEERTDQRTGELRFDIDLLAERLMAATRWLAEQPNGAALPIGYFGASTGAGAALVAAAENPGRIGAVVSRGGRPDLAGERLGDVRAPTLLIVGSLDDTVIGMNREAVGRMTTEVELEIVEGASHLFEEAGTLDRVAALARDWFLRHLAA